MPCTLFYCYFAHDVQKALESIMLICYYIQRKEKDKSKKGGQTGGRAKHCVKYIFNEHLKNPQPHKYKALHFSLYRAELKTQTNYNML